MLPVQPIQPQDLCLKLRNLIYLEKWQRPCASQELHASLDGELFPLTWKKGLLEKEHKKEKDGRSVR